MGQTHCGTAWGQYTREKVKTSDGWSNKHAHTPRGAGQGFMCDHIQATTSIYTYESEECPACAHTVHKNSTLTHTRPPRLNKWFHILPSFVSLLAACSCQGAHFIHSFIIKLSCYDSCYFDRRQCTHDVISLALSPLFGRRVKHHVKLDIF